MLPYGFEPPDHTEVPARNVRPFGRGETHRDPEFTAVQLAGHDADDLVWAAVEQDLLPEDVSVP